MRYFGSRSQMTRPPGMFAGQEPAASPDSEVQLLVVADGHGERSETRSAMTRAPAESQVNEPQSLRAESPLRLSVWEYEGGGLGSHNSPLDPCAEVVFDGVRILTSPGAVMTPRATTEALVDRSVEWIGSRSVRVADVGTGSGAVAVAIALRAPSARIWATDDSEAAIALARANVAKHGLQERVDVLLGDLLEPVPGELDLVVANLPYHAEAQSRGPAESACREQPEHAIYAPGGGLQLNRDLIEACRTRLDTRGALVIQLYGYVLSAGQAELDQLLREIEARAAEGWQPRVVADSGERGRRWSAWQSLSV
jgi:HemK-like putative methylase